MMELLQQLSTLYGDGRREAGRCRFACADVADRHGCFTSLGKHSHVITSPPYVNAQDYFRNFKLELYLLENVLPFKVNDLRDRFVGTERGQLLEAVPRESIERDFALVPALRELRDGAPRHCAVVHRYFCDMGNAFETIKEALGDNACLVIVCGDNLIGGVRICTWRALQTILEEKGFRLVDRFSDRIRDRLLPPARLGHRGLIKEEVISAYRLDAARGRVATRGSMPQGVRVDGPDAVSSRGLHQA